MAERKKVILDAGHGGPEPGAVYLGRKEKDDALNLALAVGNRLAEEGVDVVYTRVDDTYQTPYEKAQMANRSGADYFVSIHRNAMPVPNTASGAEVLVYADSGAPALLARSINGALNRAGFADLGVKERPGLVVLNQTRMPAVLVEAGFINSEDDNRFFDSHFEEIAAAVADGILAGIQAEEASEPEYYQVQTGSYRNQNLASQQLAQLRSQGFPSFLVYQDGFYKVRTGAFLNLDNAARMEREMRRYGYSTWLVREKAVE